MVPSTSNSRDMKHFLTSVLKQSGPKCVPYVESTKLSIRQHLLDLLSYYPSLHPKTSTFIPRDGRSSSVNLLQADGTVPMDHHGVTYNIPVTIWLLDSYPFHPPCVYLNPTPDMIIKPRHPHVTPSGLVSLPYLHSWAYPSSNLVGLVSEFSVSFASDPPLYSRRRPRPPPCQQQQSDDVAYKKEAIRKMVERVRDDLVSMWRDGEAEEEEELVKECKRRLREKVEEKERLEEKLRIISMNIDVLDSWVTHLHNL